MSRDDLDWLIELEDAAARIEQILTGRARSDLTDTPFMLEAILHHLAVLGEAAARVGEVTRSELPELPWREMRDTRNFVVHAYFKIDPDVIWRTCREDVPTVLATVRRLRASGRWPNRPQ